jgi:GNAT superfamily N-acetyltransferase
MHTIIPFENRFQEAICAMMDEIQDEFEIPFRNPNGKQISDIANDENLFWVAVSETRVLGTIGLSRIDDSNAFLRHLFVAKEGRGEQGLAKALLETALDKARDLKYEFLYLGTMEQFKAAQRFYDKNNFICIPSEALPEKMPVSPMDTLFYLLKP